MRLQRSGGALKETKEILRPPKNGGLRMTRGRTIPRIVWFASFQNVNFNANWICRGVPEPVLSGAKLSSLLL